MDTATATIVEVVQMMNMMEGLLKKFIHVLSSVEELDTNTKVQIITALDTAEHYQMETLCAMDSVMNLLCRNQVLADE